MRKWTDDQLKAIVSAPNLLVSAAAGSGKTAVLVERMIRKLIPDENGNYTPIERFLVVTFARDAAREMQERIKASLETAYFKETDKYKKQVLNEQLKKIPFAEFSTIDSFCMRFVKQNFHLLGIDPAFKILDQSEAGVFMAECMDEYFDLLYENNDENFFLLTSLYAKGFDDREVSGLISSVYTFTRALPCPVAWLRLHANDYKKFSESIFAKMIETNFQSAVNGAANDLKALLSLYENEARELFGGDVCHTTNIDFAGVVQSDLQKLTSAQCHWDGIYEFSNKLAVLKKSTSKKPEHVFQKRYIAEREKILNPLFSITDIVKEPSSKLDEIYEQDLYPHALAIAEITAGFDEYYFEKKNKSGKFEFNDLEHMTADLLRNDEDLRNTYIQKYEEILMDEYQDTNGLQEEIFSMISRPDNRFMVGDLKQSIYGFRSSDPMIFRDKDELYSQSDTSGTKVTLSGNFRSREGVLESINVLFRKIMTYEMGDVDYNDQQALHYLNKEFDRKHPGNDYTSEIYLIEGTAEADDDDETLSDEETEAAFVARKIKEMIDQKWQVMDKDGFRDICLSDFAIIMNAVKSDSAIYINALRECGLDGYSEDKDFFEKTEIKLINSFVKAVNNPMEDIPLVSVMRSPVYRFADEELAKIRICGYGPFWKSVLKCSQDNSELGKKCLEFKEQINKWRKLSNYMSADRIIWRIMTDCSLYDMCGILYGGESAVGNLRLYLERARVLSDGGIATLYDFQVYMDKLMKSEGMSSCLSGTNGVPIMTIHKSKGLEYPVVFLCRTGKKFVFEGQSGYVNLHKDLGFGLNDINASKGYYTPTINRTVIASAKNKENASEQLRKLYVAMTRAKEKLIVTGIVHSTKQYGAFDFTNETLMGDGVEYTKSFIRLIAPYIKNHGGNWWKYSEIEDGVVCREEVELKPAQISDKDVHHAFDEVKAQFEKYSKIQKPVPVPSKITVSELKSKSSYVPKLQRLPDFMTSAKTDGASFGTTVHKVMENIQILHPMRKEHISSEILRIIGEENEVIEDKIYAFFQSTLGVLACKNTVVREEEFEITIDGIDAKGNPSPDEKMLLQGIVDMCIFEEDRLILVDYKTDKCEDISELADKYSLQLKWYKYAVEKLLHKTVDEVYIYSFHKNEHIEISEMIN